MEVKTAIALGYRCNNNCRFCYAAEKRDRFKAMSTEQVKAFLERGRERNSTFVDFLGGEPTIRKDIIELVKFAKDLGYKTISFTTNGRMFSNKEFAKKITDAGLNSVVFSIHGHNAELHDYLVRVNGAFAQLTEGMKNFRKFAPKAYVCTNTVMLKQNLSFLPLIAENSARLGANGMEFIFPHPQGNALKHFDELVPRLTDLIEVIHETVDVGTRNGIKHCVMRYVPMCYMLGCLNNLSEFIARDVLKEEHIGPDFENLDVENSRRELARVKGPQCAGCKYFNICEGIFKEYAVKRGFEELIPVP